MHVVCVTFDIRPGRVDEFLPLMQAQARNSLDLEPECHRFDICVSDDRQSIFLYELYTDAEAFATHLASQHFIEFDAATAGFVASKQVRFFELC